MIAKSTAEAEGEQTKGPQDFVQDVQSLIDQGRYEEADALLGRAVQNYPDDRQVLTMSAQEATRQNLWAEADKRWRVVRGKWPSDATSCVLGARALDELGRGDEADRVLSEGRDAAPDDIYIVSVWADHAYRREDWAEAANRWAAARAAFPERADVIVPSARALIANGNKKEADLLLAHATARFPAETAIPFMRADLAMREHEWGAAVELWAAFRLQFPKDAGGYSHGARALIELGHNDQADDLLEAGLEQMPDHVDLLIASAELATRAGNWEEAQRRWSRARERQPRNPQLYLNGSRALIEAGRLSEAEELLKTASHGFSDRAEIAVAFAEIAVRRQLWPQAVRRWEHVRQQFPNEVQGWLGGARALTTVGRASESASLLSTARERFPGSRDILFAWAELPGLSGQTTVSALRWESVRSELPGEPRGWIEGAKILDQSWRREEANSLMEAAAANLPSSFDVMFYWALMGARVLPQEEARARWARVRTEFPHRSTGYVFGAHNLQDVGLVADAEILIGDALRLFPGELDVLRCWADIAIRRGELQTAAERLDVCIKKYPADIGFVRARIDTLLSLQLQDRALSALDAARQAWPHDAGFLRKRLMLAIALGEMDQAFALWQAIAADPDIEPKITRELGWTMVKENLASEHAREVLLYLGREPDSGAREWLPVLEDLERVRGLRPGLVEVARDLINVTPASEFAPATRDVLKCVLLLDVSDDDIRRFLETYVANGRRALTAKLFCQNYWKSKPSRLADFTRVFELYMREKLTDPSWVNTENSVALLGYLNCAAVLSPRTFRRLVGIAQSRMDVAALAHDGSLQTPESVVGSILSSTPNDKVVPPEVDDLTVRPAPSILARLPRRLRIAVCVSGQLRGYEAAFRTWSQLGLERHDTSYFVHVWKDVGHNWQRMWVYLKRNSFLWDTFVRPNGIDFLRTKYPLMIEAALSAGAAGNEANARQLSEFYGTGFVRVEDDRQSEFIGKTNNWKMHYKIEQAHRLARSSGGDFDLMLRMRPDREIGESDVDWHEIYWRSKEGRALFVDEGYLFTERHTWLADQFAAGTPELMDIYSGVFSDLNRMVQTHQVPLDVQPYFIAHSNLFYLMFYRGLLGHTVPGVKIGRLLDPVMLSPRVALDLICRDISARELDAFDKQLISACENEIIARAKTN